VTTPDWGKFIYDGAMVVDFAAPLDAGHHFVNWTADVSTTVMSTSPRRTSPQTITKEAGYSTSAAKRERSTTKKKEKA